MSAHTPGPSESGREYAERIKARDDAADHAWTSRGCDCDVTTGTPWETEALRIAYCPLHAAAPALLEAATMMIAEVKADVVGEYTSPAILALRAAIAAAKGAA